MPSRLIEGLPYFAISEKRYADISPNIPRHNQTHKYLGGRGRRPVHRGNRCGEHNKTRGGKRHLANIISEVASISWFTCNLLPNLASSRAHGNLTFSERKSGPNGKGIRRGSSPLPPLCSSSKNLYVSKPRLWSRPSRLSLVLFNACLKLIKPEGCAGVSRSAIRAEISYGRTNALVAFLLPSVSARDEPAEADCERKKEGSEDDGG